jgi:hypothetical protein
MTAKYNGQIPRVVLLKKLLNTNPPKGFWEVLWNRLMGK